MAHGLFVRPAGLARITAHVPVPFRHERVAVTLDHTNQARVDPSAEDTRNLLF